MSLQRKNPADRRCGDVSAGAILLDVLFPGRCLLCGGWLSFPNDHPAPVCGDCRAALAPIAGDRCSKCGMPLLSERETCTRCRRTDFSFRSNRAVFPHSGPARELLARLKFEGRRRLASLFADILADEMDELRSTLPLVPVPPRSGRKGPDAIELIMRSLERRHGRRVDRLLVRGGGAQQKSLDFIQRRDNLLGKIAVAPRGGRGAFPQSVLLIDDVFTTGATLDACARTLHGAGCQSVYAMTLTIEQ